MADSLERPILFSGPMVEALFEGKTQTRRLVDLGRLRIVPRRTVRSDPGFLGSEMSIPAGKSVRAGINPLGAVFAKLDSGKTLGVKPEEFDFVCPYASGATHLVKELDQWIVIADPRSRLWVREAWTVAEIDGVRVAVLYPYGRVPMLFWRQAAPEDAAKLTAWIGKTKPGIHMYRWASRINLPVSVVVLQRLQAIREKDAIAEGVKPLAPSSEPIEGDWMSRTNATHPYTFAFAKLWNKINGKRATFASNPWVWETTFAPIAGHREGRQPCPTN